MLSLSVYLQQIIHQLFNSNTLSSDGGQVDWISTSYNITWFYWICLSFRGIELDMESLLDVIHEGSIFTIHHQSEDL